MRLQEFITESAKLWGAKVRVDQANYVGYVDAQVWAANAQQARTILKQQFNIEDHHVGSVKEIKMRANQFVKESNHSDIDTSDMPLEEMYSKDAIALLKNALATGNLEQWHELEPGQKVEVMKENGIDLFRLFKTYNPSEEQVDDVLYAMIKKRQDATYQVQIGTEKRAELSKMVEELAEMRRQQARKEKLEDEAIAYQRFQDEQQRQDAFKKIEMQYQQELKVINTNHRNGMEAIRTGNSHEIQKIELAHQEAERDRDHDLTRLGQQQQHELTMQQQAQRESVDRLAELAGIKLNEALNPDLSKILAAANKFASSVTSMKIYVDDLFANHLKFGGLTAFVDYYKKHFTDQDYANAKKEAAGARQELEQFGVKVDYNESFPTDYTLEIPGQSQPYSFNVIKLLKDSMDTFSTKSTNEALSRMADLAGVPLKEAWNANMGKIYEAANSMAIAVYDLFILSNPAFRKREDPDGLLYATLQKMDPEDFEDTKELSQRDLADYGAKLTYNANNPRMFTLHVPKMEPYTFDVKEVLVTAVN